MLNLDQELFLNKFGQQLSNQYQQFSYKKKNSIQASRHFILLTYYQGKIIYASIDVFSTIICARNCTPLKVEYKIIFTCRKIKTMTILLQQRENINDNIIKFKFMIQELR